LNGDRPGEADLGLLGGQVDAGLDAVEPVELLLDAGGAGGTRHAGDGEVDLVGGLRGDRVVVLGCRWHGVPDWFSLWVVSCGRVARWRRSPRRSWPGRHRRTAGRRRRRSAAGAPREARG